MSFPMPRTPGGYSRDEVISALQKDIRRGNEELAMFWALELIPKFEDYLWQRLKVIVQEDIGNANLLLLMFVPQQQQLFVEFREKGRDGSARLVLANTILAMCRSPKTRLADHFQCAINQRRLHGWRPDIPAYALDKHTRRGRAMGRGVEHWREEGCQLSPNEFSLNLTDPYEETAFTFWGAAEGDTNQFIDTHWGKRHKSSGGGSGKGSGSNAGAHLQLVTGQLGMFDEEDDEEEEGL